MLTANDAIHGWSPAGDDDVEVNISQDVCFMAISPITPSTPFPGSVCPPLEATPPKACHTRLPPHSDSTHLIPSTAGVTRPAVAPSSDRRAQRNRSRDPSWIPRPRNAFIIFRCEYSREHAQSSQESQTDQDPSAVKTLSKRAAEAWKQLPAAERERYKGLADREREEHARLYPNYRFRPMKRQTSGTRNRSCERSQSPKGIAVEAPTPRVPSVLSSLPQKPRSSPSPEATLHSESPSPPSSAGLELFSPFPSAETGLLHDPFLCDDSTFGLELNLEDLERAEALEAYAIGLYHHELFSPFSFPEYY